MSSTLDLRTVKPGDVVELRETYRVDQVIDGAVHLRDVQYDHIIVRESANFPRPTSRRYILVSKAPVPAPVAGDILTGFEVRERMWKRGTVIQCVDGEQPFPAPLLLRYDGWWTDPNGNQFEFEDMNDEAHFKLLHVAQ